MISDKSITASFSGHRSFKMAAPGLFARTPDEIRSRLDKILRTLIEEGYTDFMCGMAEGFDIMAGEAVAGLRRRFPWIRLIAVLPFPDQSRGFDADVKIRYDALLELADETVVVRPHYTTDCFYARNDYLVDNSSVLVCYYNGSQGGTRYTVRRALDRMMRVENI